MQIQRIQTVYILLAVIAMVVYIFVPYASAGIIAESGEQVELSLKPAGDYGVLILTVATAVLLLADIFLYNSLALQRRVLKISVLLTVAVAAAVGVSVSMWSAETGVINVGIGAWNILLPVAILLEALAIRGIRHDIKLLNSYNRLR